MKKLLLLLCVTCLILTSCTYEEVSPAADAVVDGIEDVTGSETTPVSKDSTKSETTPVSKDSAKSETTPVSEDSAKSETTPAPKSNAESETTPVSEDTAEPAITAAIPEFTGEPVVAAPPETEPELADDPYKSETMPADTDGGFSFPLPGSKPAETKTGSPVPLGGKDLKIDLSKYSKAAKLLTADDIYLSSSHCGYISNDQPDRFIIETEQQLDWALKQYNLPLDKSLTEKYRLSDYTYVIEYVEVGSGGYDLKAGALLVDIDSLFFVQSADSRTPDPLSAQTAVMDGFCYMAALPKGTLMNEHYENWTYPESNAY